VQDFGFTDFRSAEPSSIANLSAVADARSGLETGFGFLPAEYEKEVGTLWVAGGSL
jgi:hypothetical protein